MGCCFSVGLKIERSRLNGKVTSPSPRSPRSEAEILQSGPLALMFLNRPSETSDPIVFLEKAVSSRFSKTLSAAKPGIGTIIAVKRLNQEWLTEINHLGNLVKLIGYCLEDDLRMLVYEFMPRGSSKNHLFRSITCFCGEVKQLEIAALP